MMRSIALLLALGVCACGPSIHPLEEKPTIYGLGIDIGSIPTTDSNPYETKLWWDYGMRVGDKLMAHPEYFVPRGTPVTAVSDGHVDIIEEVTSATDMIILVTPDDAPQWQLGYEHVDNIIVQVGDRISRGQVIAEASPDHHQTLAKTTVMPLFPTPGRNRDNTSYCPYLLLEDSVRADVYDQLNAYIAAWEADRGMTIYETDQWHSTGCYFEKMTEEESRNGLL